MSHEELEYSHACQKCPARYIVQAANVALACSRSRLAHARRRLSGMINERGIAPDAETRSSFPTTPAPVHAAQHGVIETLEERCRHSSFTDDDKACHKADTI